MCWGASECLKCSRLLQLLQLTSNDARQTAGSPRSDAAHGSAPDSQTKANGEGRAPRLRGFTGHLQLLRCLLGFSACSRPAPLPLWAGMHLYASHLGVPNAGGLFQVSFRHWECNEQQWAAGVALCESSR